MIYNVEDLSFTGTNAWEAGGQMDSMYRESAVWSLLHYYNYVIMSGIASQITSLTIVYSTVYSDADQRKHQSSASLASVRGIHRGLVNSPHKWPLTRKMFPFDDGIMSYVASIPKFSTNVFSAGEIKHHKTTCTQSMTDNGVTIYNVMPHWLGAYTQWSLQGVSL